MCMFTLTIITESIEKNLDKKISTISRLISHQLDRIIFQQNILTIFFEKGLQVSIIKAIKNRINFGIYINQGLYRTANIYLKYY